jgi:hypothetical protein
MSLVSSVPSLRWPTPDPQVFNARHKLLDHDGDMHCKRIDALWTLCGDVEWKSRSNLRQFVSSVDFLRRLLSAGRTFLMADE